MKTMTAHMALVCARMYAGEALTYEGRGLFQKGKHYLNGQRVRSDTIATMRSFGLIMDGHEALPDGRVRYYLSNSGKLVGEAVSLVVARRAS